mgnify:CR=1 FL=1
MWVGNHVTTALPGGVGLRSEHPGITRAMGLSMSWDPWPRPVATLALSLAAQARASGTPSPVGPGTPSRFRPASRDSRASAGVRQRLRPREPASAVPCPPREVLGPLGQRESGPPNRPRVASRFQPSQRLPHTGRLGARLRGLAETIAGPPSTPAPRSLSGPAPGPPRARCLAWRRRPLGGRSSLGRENKPTRVVAPPLGWRLHRGVSPHEPPKSL